MIENLKNKTYRLQCKIHIGTPRLPIKWWFFDPKVDRHISAQLLSKCLWIRGLFRGTQYAPCMSLLAIQNDFSKCGQFFLKGCQKVWFITNNFTLGLGGVHWSVVEIKFEKKISTFSFWNLNMVVLTLDKIFWRQSLKVRCITCGGLFPKRRKKLKSTL